ncbi:unnamed protein product [Heterobilharzia americana]|nr:unnamed protein product [Heterobilharzia americana]
MIPPGKYQQSLDLYKDLHRRLQKHLEFLKPSINPFEENQSTVFLNTICCQQICKSILAIYKPGEDYQVNEIISRLNEALIYAKKSENENLVGLCNKQIGQVYQSDGQYELAYQYAEQYLTAAEQCDDKLEKIKAYKLLGSINESLSKIDNAEENYNQLVDCAKSLNDSIHLIEAYVILAKFYIINTQKYDLAKEASEVGLKCIQNRTTTAAATSTTMNQLKLWYSISKSKLIESQYLNTLIAAQTNRKDIIDLIKWKNTRDNLPLFDEEYFTKVTYDSFSQKRNEIIRSTPTSICS